MSNIVITGGCGFVGSNLAVALAADGHRVTCFDNLSRRGSEVLMRRVLEHGCTFVHGDVRNPADFEKLKGEIDILIECSAEPSVVVGTSGNDARYVVDVNLLGSINCFELARERGAAVLFFSTSRVYPYTALNALPFEELATRFEPSGPARGVSADGVALDMPLDGRRSLYGATKLASEYLLIEYGANYDVPSIINRCGVIAGPWQLGKVDQGVFTYWLAQHYFERPLRYIGFGGKGKQVRDLLHIDDLAELVRRQVADIHRHRGTIYNVGGGRRAHLSLVETTAICRELTGHTLEIGSEPRDRHADVIWYITDNSGIEEYNWEPRHDARAILADIFSWLDRNHEVFTSILGS